MRASGPSGPHVVACKGQQKQHADRKLNKQFLNSMIILALHPCRAAMFTRVNSIVLCFCNKCLQNWLYVYTNFTM